MRKLGLGLVWVAAFAACGGGAQSSGGAKSPDSAQEGEGTAATDFTGTDVNGQNLHLGDYLGKKAVLLDFWSTFCQPCIAEFPHLKRIHSAYKDKGFTVIAISMDGPETIADVKPFVQRNALNFPVLLDEDSQIAAIYNPKKSAPLSVLIDKKGNVVKIHEGYNPGDEETLEAEVKEAVGK